MESWGRPRHLRSRRPQRHGRSRAGHAGGRHPDPTGAPRPAGLRLRPLPRGLRSGVDRPRRRSGAADLPGSHGQGHRRPRSHVPVPRLRRATRVRRDPPLAPVVPRRRPHERRARHPPVLASPRLGARPRHHHRPLEGRVVLLRPPRLAHRSTTERRGDRCALRRVTTSLRPRPLRHPVRRPHGGAAPITGPPHGGTAPTPGRPHGRATPITRPPPRWDRPHAGPPPRQGHPHHQAAPTVGPLPRRAAPTPGRPHHRAAPRPGRSYHRARPTPGHPPPRRPVPAPTGHSGVILTNWTTLRIRAIAGKTHFSYLIRNPVHSVTPITDDRHVRHRRRWSTTTNESCPPCPASAPSPPSVCSWPA